MASWGDIAVGEERPSFGRPTKSAVMGLLAGALGIRRDEEERHMTLCSSYGLAVKVEARGLSLIDFHTAQVPPDARDSFFESRREELKESKELKTILSRRRYHTDVLYALCLWPRTVDPPWPMADLAAALVHPIFTPYLGRKSCPPALPFHPQVREADTIREAFEAAEFPADCFLDGLPRLEKSEFYWEEGAPAGLNAVQSFIRRDTVLSRRRWQFEDRIETQGSWS